MVARDFMKMVKTQWHKGNFVCVSLNSEFKRIPAHLRNQANAPGFRQRMVQVSFNAGIIEGTKDKVCAYMLSTAPYLALGEEGFAALRLTIDFARQRAPDVPVILDANIGIASADYAEMAFGVLQSDAVTIGAYIGLEAFKPFLEMKDKGFIVLCRTSNPGADEFQDIAVLSGTEMNVHGSPFYQVVAERVAQRNENGNCLISFRTREPEEIVNIRRAVGDLPIFIQDVVSKRENIEKVMAAQDSSGQGVIINSRGIIFASNGEDFVDASREQTIKLQKLIDSFRKVPQEV